MVGNDAQHSFQAPGVFDVGPTLFGFSIHRARFELAFRQSVAGGFVQPLKTRGFFDLGLQYAPVHADQKLQRHGAFFF